MANSVLKIAEDWSPNPPDKKDIVSIKGNNYTALYWWLRTNDLPHSDKIRSGNLIQGFIKGLVESSPLKAELIKDNMIKTPTSKKKEADVLFKLNVRIYYREIKTNTNLDSEKSPATLEKIAAIRDGLKNLYPNIDIDEGFLCPAWLDSDPKKGIEGLNDFIALLGYDNLSFADFDNLGIALGSKIRAVI